MLFIHRRLLRNLVLFSKEFVRARDYGVVIAKPMAFLLQHFSELALRTCGSATTPNFFRSSMLDLRNSQFWIVYTIDIANSFSFVVIAWYFQKSPYVIGNKMTTNIFHWSPIPINTDPHNFRAYELALIQEWQPPLNFPFINQFYHPRKGLLRRAPLAQTQQFGLRRLWRQARWKTTSSQVRRVLHSPTFKSRLQSWTTLHHLGSNTKQRYLNEQHLRSNAGGVIKCYALRCLTIHLQEPHRSMALQSLDRTISFWKGKKAPKAFSFRGLWLLTPNLSKRLRSFLVSWYHSNRHLSVPFHKPSVKVIYTKHPTVGEYLYNHKQAVQLWSTTSTPSCTCTILQKFPEAVIPGTDHIVLDASKISHSFNTDELATLTGSMNNKFFPSFHRCLDTFIGHIDTWTRRNGLPPINLSLQQTFFAELWRDHLPHSQSSISSHTLTSILKFRNGFPIASFIVKTRKLPPFGSFALNFMLHAYRTPSWTPRYFHQSLFHPKSVLPPTSRTSPTSLVLPIPGPLALDVNYQLAMYSPRRRSSTIVADPL